MTQPLFPSAEAYWLSRPRLPIDPNKPMLRRPPKIANGAETVSDGTMTTIKPHRLTRYGSHPKCPRCGWDQFDDWWHVLRDRRGLQPGGKLDCGGCGKLFFIEGTPGNLFSSCFGLDETDRLIRSVTGPLRKEAPDA